MEPPPAQTSHATNKGCLIAMATLLLIGLLLGIAAWIKVQDLSAQMRLSQHGRDLYHALMTWSVDHENVLPDHDLGPGATANQAFRRLLQDRLLMDEQVFSGIRSPYLADGDLGVEPDFAQAVGPGENHWMLVGHLKMNSAGNTPLFFENALSPNWPLQWRDGWNMPEIRGRTWRGTVLVYHMDGSMNAVRLDQGREGLVLPDSAFPFQWRTKAPKILDVEDAR